MTNSKSGFSLMELMIAVIIVGILASLALPRFGKSMEKARVREAQTALSAIYSSEKIYRLDQGNFGSLAQMVANNYIADPDAANSNANWDFTSVAGGGGAQFTATATRTGGSYNNQTIIVTETFDGTVYGGTHVLRDE